MTNAQIIADIIGTSEGVIERQLEEGAAGAEVVDLVELNAALDKARMATRASDVNFVRALASVSVGYPIADERAVLRNVADMLEKS